VSAGASQGRDALPVVDASAVDLRVRLGRLTLENPVMTASGTYGKGLEFRSFYAVERLGAVVVKTITSEPRAETRRRASSRPPAASSTASGSRTPASTSTSGLPALLRTLRCPS
jgi:dihydroorotate dehydrogenase (NAD+) catalytic subunit